MRNCCRPLSATNLTVVPFSDFSAKPSEKDLYLLVELVVDQLKTMILDTLTGIKMPAPPVAA